MALVVRGVATVAGVERGDPDWHIGLRRAESVVGMSGADQLGRFSIGPVRVAQNSWRELAVSIRTRAGRTLAQRALTREEFRWDEVAGSWEATISFAVGGHWIAIGRVVDPTREPVAGARVGPMAAGGDPQADQVLGSVETDALGEFEVLHEGPAARMRLVVSAQGFRPQVRDFSAVADAVTDVGLIELDRGAAISGRVASSFAPHSRGRLVRAVREERARHAAAPHEMGELLWLDGALVRWSAEAPVDESGAFVLRGLAPGAYQVSVIAPGRGKRLRRAPSQVTVDAPADNVVVPENGALVRLCAFDLVTGSPVGDARQPAHVTYDGEEFPPGGWSLVCKGGAPSEVLFEPLAEVRATVTAPGYFPARLEFTAPVNGGEHDARIGLTPYEQAADLKLRVTRADGSVVSDVQWTLSVQLQDKWVLLASRTGSSPTGEHVVERVPAAPARLEVAPAEFGEATGRDDSLPVVIELDRSPPSVLPVVLARGGHVSIESLDASGAALPVRCWWEREGAPREPVELVDDGPPVSLYSGWTGPAGKARTVRPLRPGAHLLTLEMDGYTAAQIPVQVVAGETAHVSARLKPVAAVGDR